MGNCGQLACARRRKHLSGGDADEMFTSLGDLLRGSTSEQAQLCSGGGVLATRVPEDVVGLQEHAHARDHPRGEPPEVGDRVEDPGLLQLLIGALQQRARQPLVLRAACSHGLSNALCVISITII